MNSYQKLKQKIADQHKYIGRLLTDEKFYMMECMALAFRKEVNERIWFGDHPTGSLKKSIGFKFMEDGKPKRKKSGK